MDINAASSRLFEFPVATSADAVFKITTSRKAFFLPLKSSKIFFAFSSGSPPIISLILAIGRSISDGLIENSLIEPFFNSAQYVSPVIDTSSKPSLPCTIQALVEPKVLRDFAKGIISDLSYTPRSCFFTNAGFDNGPSKLKIVIIAHSYLIFPTYFMAVVCLGANKKQIPILSRHLLTILMSQSILTDNALSTLAAPDLELAA